MNYKTLFLSELLTLFLKTFMDSGNSSTNCRSLGKNWDAVWEPSCMALSVWFTTTLGKSYIYTITCKQKCSDSIHEQIAPTILGSGQFSFMYSHVNEILKFRWSQLVYTGILYTINLHVNLILLWYSS